MYRSGKLVKSLIVIILILTLSFLVINYLGKPKLKDYTPRITATLLNGTPVTLEQYRGKPVLIYFWSTWCPTCKFQSPLIEELAKEYPVLGVCIYSGTDKQVREFMARNGYTFATLNDQYNEVRRAFSVKAVPTFFVLDAEGKIVFSEVGMTSGFGMRTRMKLVE